MNSIIKGLVCLFLTYTLWAKAQGIDKSITALSKVLSGSITLNSGTEISSAFTLSPEESLTTYVAGYLTEAYTPKDVQSFYFFDSVSNSIRHFYSLPFKIGDPSFHFFELIHQTDHISILGRFELEEEGVGAASTFISTMVLIRYGRVRANSKAPKTYKAVYKRYLLDHRHDVIHELSKTKLLELINDSTETLNYVDKQKYKLNEEQFPQYVDVVDFYSNSQKPLAK